MTMKLISTITVATNSPNLIEFTGIPQDATDLYLKFSLRYVTAVGGISDVLLRFNGDATNNYSYHTLRTVVPSSMSRGSAAGIGYVLIPSSVPTASESINTFGNGTMLISDYATSSNKLALVEAVGENSNQSGGFSLTVGFWNVSAGITSVRFWVGSYGFEQNSTISLYTITKGSGGANVS